MDLATLIGFVLAWGAVVFSMFHASEGHLEAYFKPGGDLPGVRRCTRGGHALDAAAHRHRRGRIT